MKKYLVTLTTIVLSYYAANAQYSVGLKAGFNIADAKISGITESLIPDAKSYTGYTTGILFNYAITDQLSVQPELNLVQRGFKVKEDFGFDLWNIPIPLGIDVVTKVKYVELPLQLKYKFSDGSVQPYIIGGPSIAYATDGKIKEVVNFLVDINVGSQDINLNNSNFNRWEVGGRLGAGIAFKTILGEINLEAGYYHGFTDFFKDPIVDIHAFNKGITLQAGWMISF